MLHDFMMSLRRIVRAPLFSLTLVAVLSVGIGATATMVSVLDALLWRPVAMPQPHELVDITTVLPDGTPHSLPLVSVEQITQAALPVESWCAYTGWAFTTRVDGRVMTVGGALMSAGCVKVTRMAPVMGRWFTPAEAPVTGRGRAVAVITDRYWARMFNRAPDVLGRALRLDDGNVTVIGVLPASFEGFGKDVASDIITPFGVFEPQTAAWDLIARKRPGTSLEALRAQVTAVWGAIIKDTSALTPNPREAAQLRVHVQSAAMGFTIFRRLYAPALSSVTKLAVLLLVLTCINASGLLATKVTSHRDEILVMRALGATSWRIVRQLLTEAFIVASAGCVVGGAIAYLATSAFRELLPWGNMPWTIEFTPDSRIVAGVAGACLVVTMLIAIVPAWLATGAERVVHSSRTMTRRASRWSDAMLIGQLAATVVLVFACGLLVRSYTGLAHVDRGFDPSHLLSVRLLPAPGGYEHLNQQEYYTQLFQQFAAIPGVESVGFAAYFGTIDNYVPPEPIALVSGTTAHTTGAMEYVSPNFFRTVRVPILRGRDVAWTDRPDTPRVALVSESLAHDLDAHDDILGRSIDFGSDTRKQRLQIVGVVGNISLGNYRQNAVRLVFVPALQVNNATWPTFQLRTRGDPLEFVRPVTRIVNTAGREYVQRAAHVDDMFSNSLVAERMASFVGTGTAALGVLLAALGLYALLTHSVTLRMREIGIRMAVGAAPRSIGALITRHTLGLVAGGVAVGLPAALMASSMVRTLLFGVSVTDGGTLAAAIGVVIVAGVAASVVPVVRASRIDPVQLLRAE